jgi:hypothetical protein
MPNWPLKSARVVPAMFANVRLLWKSLIVTITQACYDTELKVHLHRRCGQAISPSNAISIEDFPSFQNRHRHRQRQVFIVFTPV